MTLVDGILGVVALAAVVGVVLLAAWLRSALNARNAATEAIAGLEKERDDYKVTLDQRNGELANLKRSNATLEQQRNQTYADTLMHVRNELDKASMTDAVAVVTDLFATPLPGAQR